MKLKKYWRLKKMVQGSPQELADLIFKAYNQGIKDAKENVWGKIVWTKELEEAIHNYIVKVVHELDESGFWDHSHDKEGNIE
jgi:hypothetical protein